MTESVDAHAPGTAPESEDASRRKFRVASRYPLPSERVAWPNHFKLLANAAMRSGFGKDPVDSEAIGEGVGNQAAQLNVAFFVDVGLFTKTNRKYLPTEPCLAFVRTRKLDEGRARPILHKLLEKTWFAEVARNTLTIRDSISHEELVKELAIASEVSNFEAKSAAFNILVEYLLYTGIVARDGELISLPQEIPSEAMDVSSHLINRGEHTPAPIPPRTPEMPQAQPSVQPVQQTSAHRAPDPSWAYLNTDFFELRIKKSPAAWALLKAILPAFEQGTVAEPTPDPAPELSTEPSDATA